MVLLGDAPLLDSTRLRTAVLALHNKDHDAFLASKSGMPLDEQYEMRNFAKSAQGNKLTGDESIKRMDAAFLFLQEHCGYNWSRMQRRAYEAFLEASARAIYPKNEWLEALPKLQKRFGKKRLSQEVFLAAYRRSGKTIVTSAYSGIVAKEVPDMEVSVFSTGRRASNKFLAQTLQIVCKLPGGQAMVNTCNQETLELRNPLDFTDKRRVNSFPSKVQIELRTCTTANFSYRTTALNSSFSYLHFYSRR
jgi:hypothetical protein